MGNFRRIFNVLSLLLVITLLQLPVCAAAKKSDKTQKSTKAPKATKNSETKLPASQKETIVPDKTPINETKTPASRVAKTYADTIKNEPLLIVVEKAKFKLHLFKAGKEIKSYDVAIGKNPGQKERVGDMTTPSGEFKVDEIIAEDTRKRNDETTKRFTEYVKNKIKNMALEKDAVDYVIFHKQFYNKTAKEAESLDNIDVQLTMLEKNFAAYIRAEKKINDLAKKAGAVFHKDAYLHRLSKYGEDNADIAAEAEEEAERILAIPPEEKEPVKTEVPVSAAIGKTEVPFSAVDIRQSFPVYDKKKSKGSDEITIIFTVPKEMKKSFNELLKNLKEVGITNKK